MIGDIACLGICIIDPETGICEGCGRGPEDVSPIATAKPARHEANATSHSALVAAHQHHHQHPYPLPPQVLREAATPCD
jgi:predicted Fe-S protein YdhL (DUF1289 family)